MMLEAVNNILEEARLTARALVEFSGHLFNPTLRLGVTGLAGAGKTVFMTALLHHLLDNGRLPVFEALSSGRIVGARLKPQPDDTIPRFDYETHVHTLIDERRWPESTRRVSEVRLVISYQSVSGRSRELTLDVVDYPGEWLLDLPLLAKSYYQWSTETLLSSRRPPRATLARSWHQHLATLFPEGVEDEIAAITAARLFTEYLQACRDQRYAMSLLPPGRFLMPGDPEGSPALTFAPLDLPHEGPAPAGSLWALMERRFEAYKDRIVRPFFREHFARLDRQIVLVDALAALNAGSAAMRDLEDALTAILDCFRVGRRSWWNAVVRPRIDRILFAATKADHLHHTSHDRLERILARMTERAVVRAKYAGARIDVIALAAVRATREAIVSCGQDRLPSIVGTPIAGETAGSEVFDGMTEAAIFPGDLPEDPTVVLESTDAVAVGSSDLRFLRFRPPAVMKGNGGHAHLPHIRLDRALQFVLGDLIQ